jgi:hypothetical protein
MQTIKSRIPKTVALSAALFGLSHITCTQNATAQEAALSNTTARNATLPSNQKLNWGEEAVKTISSTRGEMSLNGLWRFIPAEGEAGRDPQSGWGYIRVPGSWKNNNDIVARGEGSPWKITTVSASGRCGTNARSRFPPIGMAAPSS